MIFIRVNCLVHAASRPLLSPLLIVMIFIVSSSYFIHYFSGLLMNHFDFMTVAFQLWGRVKERDQRLSFGTGFCFETLRFLP